MSEWSIYIIKTRLNTLYTGITTDVERRFEEHSSGDKRGARYLKGKGPLELMWQQKVGTRSEASILEYRVKQLKKVEKLQLLKGEFHLSSLVKEEGLTKEKG